jgi:signal peptidase
MGIGKMDGDKIILPNALVLEHLQVYLRQGKQVSIPVKGNSMLPFLRNGDQVLIKPFEASGLRKGMILLASVQGQMVLHRLVKFNAERVLLAGDANLAQHEDVSIEDVIGSATTVMKGLKELKLDKWQQRYLGQLWYWIRPLRRVVKKII